MKKKIILVLLIIVALTAASYSVIYKLPIQTDSGWDSSYDSGGGSSSSSFGSDHSSSDRSSSSRSSGSNSRTSDFDYSSSEYNEIIKAMIILFFIIFVYILIKYSNISVGNKQQYKSSLQKQLDKYFRNSPMSYTTDSLTKELYQIFVDVQIAWMNFDYEALKKLCSEELYNTYKTELEALKQQNGQNIMKNFNLDEMIIISIKKVNLTVTVLVKLKASFNDYVINTDTNKVIKGRKLKKMHNKYQLEYMINLNQEKNVCPNCGHELDSSECDYCHSYVNTNKDHFILTSKRIIG